MHRTKGGKRLWWEYNITRIEGGFNKWEGASHHWVEAEHDFAAFGNRPGLVLFRKDIGGFPAQNGFVKILEFFIPNDSVDLISMSKKAIIYMRWTSAPVGTILEKREVPIGIDGFKETEFEISEIVTDP